MTYLCSQVAPYLILKLIDFANFKPIPSSAPMVTLKVGNASTGIFSFQVHEPLLCKLKFFKAALQGGFKEASTRVIEMPEDDPVAMASSVEFLYTGDYTDLLPVVPETPNPQSDVVKENIYGPKLYNARVIVIGEKYNYQALCQKAVTKCVLPGTCYTVAPALK